jgi:hypothetical protein
MPGRRGQGGVLRAGLSPAGDRLCGEHCAPSSTATLTRLSRFLDFGSGRQNHIVKSVSHAGGLPNSHASSRGS